MLKNEKETYPGTENILVALLRIDSSYPYLQLCGFLGSFEV